LPTRWKKESLPTPLDFIANKTAWDKYLTGFNPSLYLSSYLFRQAPTSRPTLQLPYKPARCA
jgi:hypothetical protein